MSTKLIYMISLIMAVSLVGHVQAATRQFRNSDPSDNLWSTEGNWDPSLPGPGDWAKIRGGEPGCLLNSDVGEVLKLAIGYDPDTTLTIVDGGILTTEQYFAVGRNSEGATFNMEGGIVNCGQDFYLGHDNEGFARITGGTFNVGRDLELPRTGKTYTVHLDLHGGTVNVENDLWMAAEGTGTMDITAGTLIFANDVVETVQGFIDNGFISAYDGEGTIQMDYNVTNDAQTTVTGLHKFNPYPADGGIASPGQTELSWTLPAEVIKVDVWFSDDVEKINQGDPSALLVNQTMATSAVVQTQLKSQYYWAVDTYVGDDVNDPNYGHVFQFVADNVPPVVNAGEDVLAWLDNGSVDVALAATVTDSDPTTTIWTVVSEPDDPNNPDAVIADPSSLNTTLTLAALGEYVLQLKADDGEYQDTDTLTINVYSDHCAAAKAQPDYVPMSADLNGDCHVDQDDLDLLLENWLKCNDLDCSDPNHIQE